MIHGARSASIVEEFPYCWAGVVCYFTGNDAGELVQCFTRDDLRVATQRAIVGEVELFAVWPGRWRSDLFVIDEPALLADAIGITDVAT